MKTNLKRVLSLMMAVLCMAAFSVTAFASDGGYYASDEDGNKTPPDAIDSITISKENVELETDGGNATTEIDGEVVDLDSFFDDLFNIFGGTDALTPVGNLTLIDDILQSENNASVESVENEQKSKQFITVQSKNGNYFYIIIDRSGDKENVYFLNLVDEADLFALLEDGETEQTPAVCSCTDKCAAGAVNTACEICMVNMSECAGKEAVTAEPEPDTEPEEPAEEKENNTGILLIVVLLMAAGGGAAFYFLVLKPKQNRHIPAEPDDYDLEDEEDYVTDDEDTEENI